MHTLMVWTAFETILAYPQALGFGTSIRLTHIVQKKTYWLRKNDRQAIAY